MREERRRPEGESAAAGRSLSLHVVYMTRRSWLTEMAHLSVEVQHNVTPFTASTIHNRCSLQRSSLDRHMHTV